MRGRLSAGLICVVVAVSLALAPAASAMGELDPSFGQGGLALSPPGTAFGGGLFPEVDAAPDGSTFVTSGGSATVRFGPEGAWDGTFAGDGSLSLSADQFKPEEGEIEPWSTAVDSKGRFLVFGAELDGQSTGSGSTEGGSLIGSEAVVLRFDPDGTPDPTLGGGTGLVRSTFGIKSTYEIASFPMVIALTGTVDSQDRPVIALGATEPVGGCYAKGGPGIETRAVVRLTEAGLPDASFGKGGVALTRGTARFPVLGLASGDQPVVDVGPTGGREPECRRGATVIRLDENGARLAGYGRNGARRVEAFSLALVEPSGASLLSYERRHTLELRQLGRGGGEDRSFGDDGLDKLARPGARGASVRPVAVDSQGRILMVGSIGAQKQRTKHVGRSALVVGRLLASGRPDPSFGEGGWIFTRFAPGVEIEGAAGTLDAQGRLLVSAVTRSAKEELGGYVLARYLLES
jgi:hypothetical protein